jgi:hypothetical protein
MRVRSLFERGRPRERKRDGLSGGIFFLRASPQRGHVIAHPRGGGVRPSGIDDKFRAARGGTYIRAELYRVSLHLFIRQSRAMSRRDAERLSGRYSEKRGRDRTKMRSIRCANKTKILRFHYVCLSSVFEQISPAGETIAARRKTRIDLA